MSNRKRERRVNTRLHGLELNLLEQSGLSYKNVVRYGLLKYMEERPFRNSHIIQTEIAFLRDKITEYELLIEGCELAIAEKVDELTGLRETENSYKYNGLVSRMYDRYLEFLESDYLTEEFRSDLTNFYSYCKDGIIIIASRYGKSYDEAINYFEEYLDSIFDDSQDIDVCDDELLVDDHA